MRQVEAKDPKALASRKRFVSELTASYQVEDSQL